MQNQIHSLEKASSSLGLIVNHKNVMLFGKGGHIAATEKWFYNNTEIEIVNACKYLGYTLTNYLLM